MLHIRTAQDFISVFIIVLLLRTDLDRLRGVPMALHNSNQFTQNAALLSKIQFNIATQKNCGGPALLLERMWMVGWESFSMWNLTVCNALGTRDDSGVYQGIMAELLNIVGISQESLHT